MSNDNENTMRGRSPASKQESTKHDDIIVAPIGAAVFELKRNDPKQLSGITVKNSSVQELDSKASNDLGPSPDK